MNETITSAEALATAKDAADKFVGKRPESVTYWMFVAAFLSGQVAGLSVELDVWKRDSVKVPF